MADVKSGEPGSAEPARHQEAVSKSYPVLRPSAFAANSSTQLKPDTSAGTPTHFGSNTFGSKSSSDLNSDANTEDETSGQTPSRFQLRPSLLDKHASALSKDTSVSASSFRGSTAFKLEPPKLCSPLSSKFADNNKLPSVPSAVPSGSTSAEVSVTAEATSEVEPATTVGSIVSTAGSSFKCTNTSQSAEFVFGAKMDDQVTVTTSDSSVPCSLSTTAVSSSAAVSSSGFVFGSNLADRVVMSASSANSTTAVNSMQSGSEEGTPVTDDKVASNFQTKTSEGGGDSATAAPSLEESAAIQQAKQSRLELQEVAVVTGEEDESNVFQFNAKLYVFEQKTQSWLERGIGLLRLNDKSLTNDSATFQSRLVMRCKGSLRVVLNTMIWPNMLIERATRKSIKLSATDPEDGIKIYLIQANPNDADQIYNAIYSRAQKLKAADCLKRPQPPPKDSATSTPTTTAEKRSVDAETEPTAEKRRRVDPEQRQEQGEDESNDSSAVDPETEASNEGFSSSPTIQSSSSEA